MLEAQQRHAEKLPRTHTDSGVTDSLTNLCKHMLVILAVFTQQDLRVFLSCLVWLHAPFMSKYCIYGRFACIPLSIPMFLTSYPGKELSCVLARSAGSVLREPEL